MDESFQLTVLLIMVVIIGFFFLHLLRNAMMSPVRVAKKVTDKTKEKTGQKLSDVREKIHTKKEKRRAASQRDRRSNESMGLPVEEDQKELRKKIESWKKKMSRKKSAKDRVEGLVSEPMIYPGEPLPA